jgi:hypothetical protein
MTAQIPSHQERERYEIDEVGEPFSHDIVSSKNMVTWLGGASDAVSKTNEMSGQPITEVKFYT